LVTVITVRAATETPEANGQKAVSGGAFGRAKVASMASCAILGK